MLSGSCGIRTGMYFERWCVNEHGMTTVGAGVGWASVHACQVRDILKSLSRDYYLQVAS